ncbi:hypothetical protein [Chitinivorax sp. B]|uniref:hypothetical protein n=1 Tax=Chitinivorax sp. B TaxID=2502235 RepID=UPI002017CFC8|nr:hypothetical protein [Chitinivorax sp. B]
MAWSAWWDAGALSEAARIAYFKQWPPPPCWLVWMIEAIWDLQPWESEDEFDYSPYFAQAEALGFGTQADYKADLDDPRWA